jgi:hypothetical protein
MNTRVRAMVLASLVVVVAVPALAQVSAQDLHVRMTAEPPPAVKSEPKTARTQKDAQWLKGYWDRQEQEWAWVSGRWEQPTDRHAWWVPATYTKQGAGWRYAPAHWSNQNLIQGEDYRQWHIDHPADGDAPRFDKGGRQD